MAAIWSTRGTRTPTIQSDSPASVSGFKNRAVRDKNPAHREVSGAPVLAVEGRGGTDGVRAESAPAETVRPKRACDRDSAAWRWPPSILGGVEPGCCEVAE
jgi:hypothetical protein